MSVHALGPPYPGDPARLGGFRILGRQSAGSQGAVYLAARRFTARVHARVKGR